MMAELTPINGNGCYVVSSDGTQKIPLRQSVLRALKRMTDEKLTGSISLHMKSGGLSAVETKIIESS